MGSTLTNALQLMKTATNKQHNNDFVPYYADKQDDKASKTVNKLSAKPATKDHRR